MAKKPKRPKAGGVDERAVLEQELAKRHAQRQQGKEPSLAERIEQAHTALLEVSAMLLEIIKAAREHPR